MKLSIVIVSWNTRELLGRCLASIYAHLPALAYDIWVIDNGSEDGSPSEIRERFPQIHLIENEKNMGFARANNLGIQQSQGQYVVLLNPDTEVQPDALDELIRFLENNEEAGAAGPRLLNPNGTLQMSAYPAPTLWREFWRLFHLDRIIPFGVYDMRRWKYDQPRQVDVLMGACLVVRREVFNQVGLLEEDYFMYSEEVDLCTRIRRGGWKLFWVPGAEVIHYGGQSTKQVAGEMFLELYRSKILYFRMHSNHLSVLIYKCILGMAALVRLALTPFASLVRPLERGIYKTLSGHYRRLLIQLPKM